MKKEGRLIVISSPSGGGKDSIINSLVQIIPHSARLVTTTTRPMRPGNIEGLDYYFISQKTFKSKLAKKDFVEFNVYSNNYYGIQKKHLKQSLSKYQAIFTPIEVNGKHSLDKLKIPHLAIFLLPESLAILKKRIKKRGGLTPEQIKQRMRIAREEIKQSQDYNYRVVNREGKLNQTIAAIAKIITRELKK